MNKVLVLNGPPLTPPVDNTSSVRTQMNVPMVSSRRLAYGQPHYVEIHHPISQQSIPQSVAPQDRHQPLIEPIVTGLDHGHALTSRRCHHALSPRTRQPGYWLSDCPDVHRKVPGPKRNRGHKMEPSISRNLTHIGTARHPSFRNADRHFRLTHPAQDIGRIDS